MWHPHPKCLSCRCLVVWVSGRRHARMPPAVMVCLFSAGVAGAWRPGAASQARACPPSARQHHPDPCQSEATGPQRCGSSTFFSDAAAAGPRWAGWLGHCCAGEPPQGDVLMPLGETLSLVRGRLCPQIPPRNRGLALPRGAHQAALTSPEPPPGGRCPQCTRPPGPGRLERSRGGRAVGSPHSPRCQVGGLSLCWRSSFLPLTCACVRL